MQTKHQRTVFEWLHMLIVGFMVIWISYVLNIIENRVPYIIGPIMYSIVVYFLSYKAFQLKVTELDGGIFKSNDNILIFKKIMNLIIKEEIYLEPDISLSGLSKMIGRTTQKTSEVINQYANQNFNDFINYYRIQGAKRMLLDGQNTNLTIASIAFDAGFSSLSSFNSAFKKFEKTTPSAFKKSML
ncbi:MAG: helix-turn-helix domain-containing protein [Flavobacteriaceae bacterium]